MVGLIKSLANYTAKNVRIEEIESGEIIIEERGEHNNSEIELINLILEIIKRSKYEWEMAVASMRVLYNDNTLLNSDFYNYLTKTESSIERRKKAWEEKWNK